MNKHGSVFGGAMLIAGTSIGGAMLALPVLTSLGGFVSLDCPLFGYLDFHGLYGAAFLEACLWMKEETNFISMADHSLGFLERALPGSSTCSSFTASHSPISSAEATSLPRRSRTILTTGWG